MSTIPFFKPAIVLIEISQTWLKAARDGKSVGFSVERGNDGRLTETCRETLVAGLNAFVNKKSMGPRPRAFCCVGAMGVSQRRLSLPSSTKLEIDKILRLQIEAEFPLSPDELAWGYRELAQGTSATRELLVVAVKREVIEDYKSVFAAAGLDPVFTLAPLVRNLLCPQPLETHALLDVGGERPEWTVFEKGVPTSLRLLPATAEVSVLESVSKLAGSGFVGRRIYLSGASRELAARLADRLRGIVECVPLTDESEAPAAIVGLKKVIEQGNEAQLLPLQNRAKPQTGIYNLSKGELKPWLIRAAALICVLLMLPYAEALVLKPFLTRKLARLDADKGRLAMIDHELDFLQSVKQSQPPYLDALFVLAKSAPPGTRFDTLNMNRQGDIALHGVMQNGNQVTDFRAKLIGSGFFSNVSVEEQTPTPDRQRVNLRMSAHWKPTEGRVGLAIAPTPEEIQQAKTNVDAGGAGGGFPPGMMFPGN